MTQQIVRLSLALAACALWLAPALARAGDVPPASVRIENFHFVPERIELPVGGSVTWTNADEELHALVAVDGSFHSPGLDTDGSYTHAFAAAGTYEYRCTLHPQMKGTVVVR
jgi:plastocyanin